MRASLPLAILFTSLLLAACGKQGEGERCDRQAESSGNADCQSGLVCVEAAKLNGSTTDRCCPSNRETATSAVCRTASSQFGGDASQVTPVDSGAETSVDSAVNDAATDSGGDASTDAPADGADAAVL